VTEDKIKVGQEFMESVGRAIGRKRRTVIVIQTGIYFARVRVLDGQGRNHKMQAWNKHLCDPTRWKLIDPDDAHTVQT